MAEKPKPKPKPKRKSKTDKDQSERFIETARKLECDESEDALDRAFETIVPIKSRKQPHPEE